MVLHHIHSAAKPSYYGFLGSDSVQEVSGNRRYNNAGFGYGLRTVHFKVVQVWTCILIHATAKSMSAVQNSYSNIRDCRTYFRLFLYLDPKTLNPKPKLKP